MGISNKSHGKKSDKETQSPVLKLFKDMMQKEKHDPEKTNLLKSKHAERKKKYFGSRSKSDPKTVECSSSDHMAQNKGNQDLRNPEFEPSRTQSYPFQKGKRESWWLWGENDVKKPDNEDTCSCVSCALKKIFSSDYACVACLGILFTVSVIVAFLLVYKSIPCLTSTNLERDNDRLKRKTRTDGLSGWRWDHFGKRDRKWESSNPVPESMDFTATYQDMSSLVDSGSELSKILDGDKMSEIQSSDRLREFFKKLIQTDTQIRNLKKDNELNMNNIDNVDNIDDKYKTYPDRAKRSLKIFNRPMKFFQFKKKHDKIVKGKLKDDMQDNAKGIVTKAPMERTTIKNAKSEARNKRFDNTSEPEGFVIENKKIFVQYKPNIFNKKVAKCSHAPKESKSHEHQLKHPFYQNTQRLDELLDKFLVKNLPDIMADPFGMDILFGNEKNKCKHPKVEDIFTENKQLPEKTLLKDIDVNKEQDNLEIDNAKEKAVFEEMKAGDHGKVLKTETSTFRNDVLDDWELIDGDLKREGSTTNMYDVLMSVSTMMYDNKLNKRTNFPLKPERAPNLRKLLQSDVDNDQSTEHVDLKEMHTVHDEFDKEGDIKKSMDKSSEDITNQLKMKPVSVLNPNWKGPMPLYPEELNSMVKQGPIIVNRVEVPAHSKDSSPELDELEIDLTDTEYIEDYLHNKYERLVQMAQAYSDYGVLNSKKEPEKKIDDNVTDKRVKLSIGGLREGLMNGIFGRPKNGDELSEGIRFEIQPTSSTSEDIPLDIYRSLQKHLKVTNLKGIPFLDPTHYTPSLDMDLLYTAKNADALTTTKKIVKDNGIVFTVGNGRRSLKSVEYDDDDDDDYYNVDDSDDDNPILNIKSPFDISNFKFKRAIDNSTTWFHIIDDNATNTSSKINNHDVMSGNSSEKDLSDFFMMLSQWFATLDGVDISLNNAPNSRINNETIGNTTTPTTHLDKKIDSKNETKELLFPIYDSDMIENIGHRSRVLLSIDSNSTDEIRKNDRIVATKETSIENTVTRNITSHNIEESKNENKTKIVKRNADSNLIFWNDIYDEEYGVDLENFENNIRDKHSIDRSDFIKKPNAWFRDKVRKITDGIHRKAQSLSKKENNVAIVNAKKEQNAKEDTKSKSKQAFYKRISRNVAQDTPKKTDFAALTAKMRAICRKTAKDIEKTRKVDVREESKDGQVASSLMQQLVRLMSDLVDYQVQQRTCRKLPPDLQNFLEWLTSTSPESDSAKYSSEYKNEGFPEMDFSKTNDKSSDHTLDMASSSEREDKSDSRSDCLGTLQTVQELMRQFEDMTDDDKSKMAGVREYLETQINYLQKQMSSINDYNIYNTIRYRRDVTSDKNHKHRQKKRKRRMKIKFNNFMKNFTKKQKTANDNEKADTDIEKANINIKNANINNVKANNKMAEKKQSAKDNIKSSKKDKRNLRDIYYKAIADAKKITTAKRHKYVNDKSTFLDV